MRRLGTLLMTITLILLGCGAPATAPAPPRVYDVQVDAKASSFSLAAGLYFPREGEAHAGDTVRFTPLTAARYTR